MASNRNLFYNLYSNSNNVIRAGYTCGSAIDEHDTSFDITVGATGGSAGTITDSNGNTLTSIDLSQIHTAGITQYTNETRIIQPHSCCVLQGQEFGIAQAEYYYVIPKYVKETEDYEYFLGCDFDVIYDNFAPMKFHVHVDPDGIKSLTQLINEQFDKFNILIATSLLIQDDVVDKKTHHYLRFMAQKEGYFYYINNLRINIAFQSEKQPTSPFKKGINDLKVYMYDLIKKYHPLTLDEEQYDPDTYEVNCELYAWLLYNYEDAVKDLESFNKMIECLHNAIDHPEQKDEWIRKANIAIQNTVYDVDDLFDMYSIENIEIIRNIILEIKSKLDELSGCYKDFYWLREDRHLRVPVMKYPNGAFRGIILIPDWPVNTDDYEYASLWINHIKSKVKLYQLTPEKQYMPKIVGVLSNATLLKEETEFRNKYSQFGTASVDNVVTTLRDGWDEILSNDTEDVKDFDTDYLDPYRPDLDVIDDLTWMGNNYYSRKDDIIGLFRYMQYVNENNLWNKVGDAYMIIGKDDDPQSHNLNLPTSLMVYNPNDVPIRVRYMIFS